MYLLFSSRSKAKAKPRRRTPACSSTRTVLIGERTWTEIEPENYSSIAYPVSKQLSALLRHGQLPRRRKQAKISILYWSIRTRNSLPPSSSSPFKTQSHWSWTTGQCVNSGQFLQVHSSYWMCDQFTLHHKIRIDTRRTNFKQGKTDSILYGCESHGQGTQRSVWYKQKTWKRHVYWVGI